MNDRADSFSSTGLSVLIASSVLSIALGSIHGFSVFLEPLEGQFQTTRSSISFTYSLALVFLTFAVLMGHRIFGILRSTSFVFVVCLLAAFGALLAANASSLLQLWFGYGVLFGAANGLGYGFGLQISAQANPQRAGLAMGIVTACYALGAVISPPVFTFMIAVGGFQAAMLFLAGLLAVLALICAGLLSFSKFQFENIRENAKKLAVPSSEIFLLWAAYGTAVAAGLMSIGHATGILKEMDWDRAIWIAPAIIALCNMVGSLIGGAFVDRYDHRRLLGGLSALSGSALVILAFVENVALGMVGLGLVGFSYGALIASYPAVILKRYGSGNSTRIYGRVFTAWGLAGLFAPLLAALLYDQRSDYTFALIVAAAASWISVILILRLSDAED